MALEVVPAAAGRLHSDQYPYMGQLRHMTYYRSQNNVFLSESSRTAAEIYSQELTFGCRKKKTAAVVFHLGSEFTTHLACSPVCVDS